MPDPMLTMVYLPTAVVLGALHAIEPGHSKTLMAAYLIGIRGSRFEATLLGLAAAGTHSVVVIVLAVAALWLGKETFTEDATYWLQISSSLLAILLAGWLFWRSLHHKGHSHPHPDQGHDHPHPHPHAHPHEHEHEEMDAHARAHAAAIPVYVQRGEHPSRWQILLFGMAGGMLPCPASISVMIMALSLNEMFRGILAVLGFSFGLALTLVGVGWVAVTGMKQFSKTSRFEKFGRTAPLLSAGLVLISGLFGLFFAGRH